MYLGYFNEVGTPSPPSSPLEKRDPGRGTELEEFVCVYVGVQIFFNLTDRFLAEKYKVEFMLSDFVGTF